MKNHRGIFYSRSQIGLVVIYLSVLVIFLFNTIYPFLNMSDELWGTPYLFPVIKPIGTDFREGLFYPAKVLLQGKSPYVQYASNYPPLAILVGIPFRLFNVQTAYLVQVAVLFFLTITSIWQAVFLVHSGRMASARPRPDLPGMKDLGIFLPVAILAISGYGFLFSIERGNYDIYPQFFILLGIWALIKKPGAIWLQVFFFSFAAHLKLYPAVMFFLVIWKHGWKSLLPLAVINVGLLFITGYTNAGEFLRTMSLYIQAPFLWVGNQSASSFAVLVNQSISRWSRLQVPTIVFILLPVVTWVVSAYFCWKRKYNPINVLWLYAISVPVMNLLPNTSHDYKLVLVYAPIAICLYFLVEYLRSTGKHLGVILIGAIMVLAFFLGRSYTLLPDFLGNKYPFVLALQVIFLISMITTEVSHAANPQIETASGI